MIMNCIDVVYNLPHETDITALPANDSFPFHSSRTKYLRVPAAEMHTASIHILYIGGGNISQMNMSTGMGSRGGT